MKILVIEDDADIASNIGQYFEAKGHELDFAYSGPLGLKLAIDRRFDLIILDLMLPGKDGITVCREFREQSKHDTPILMLTARDTIDDKAYHVTVASLGDDRVYIRHDVTEIERSEELLEIILSVAWVVLLVVVFVIARILSKKLSGPIAQLSQELSRINPDERGVRLSDRFENDEVGRIAQAFDSYTRKMDSYVEKQMAFAAMASHELRSPLTIVQTSADLISSRHDDPETVPHLEKIQRASANMANMIHALLAVTRDQPTSNTGERIALRPLVDEIIESLGPELDAKQITVENRLAEEIVLETDKTLITVVLANLIKNGVKHGQQSSIRIDMQASLLTITDRGIGIDSKSLQSIFDFGYRGQNSQGYGVGLYISRLICDYLGWVLELAPNPTGGIIAKVRFPD